MTSAERVRVQIDLMECRDCGKYALGFADLRITGHKCSGSWKVIEKFVAEFTVGELFANAELLQSGASHDRR